jgi:hypothetical protein
MVEQQQQQQDQVSAAVKAPLISVAALFVRSFFFCGRSADNFIYEFVRSFQELDNIFILKLRIFFLG